MYEYTSPFTDRYGSDQMRRIFSNEFKFNTWRRLWIRLAEAEKELGIHITNDQINELKNHSSITESGLKLAAEYEKTTKHDVMAHILAYSDECPTARPIIHLGATSCYVTDNTEVIQQARALIIVSTKLESLISKLSKVAVQYAHLPTVAYTHYQVAQPTTLGKRMCMWIQDLDMDMEQLRFLRSNMKLLGCKGATGTAASFVELFNGDYRKVKRLEDIVFNSCDVFPISGQTYTRKQDFSVMQVLAGIAQSASKFANDIRLLSNLGEVTESYSPNQVGSSAMPYKSNPIRCEKMNSLGRFVICNLQNSAMTAATQWLERTLDDSAIRRISIPEMFLAVDEILDVYNSVVDSLHVNEDIIEAHFNKELPYLVMEPILMYETARGGDRQKLHAKLMYIARTFSADEFAQCITEDLDFSITEDELDKLSDPRKLTGLAYRQTLEFLSKLQ